VFDGSTLAELQSFFAYDAAFTGGVTVGVNTLSNGHAAILTGAGPGGGPHVKEFDGQSLALLESFFAFDPSFSDGVFVGGR
jgi:hypothetical protein